jgi:metal-responsive CopG/Arc/MetJ family transcriptional regulator
MSVASQIVCAYTHLCMRTTIAVDDALLKELMQAQKGVTRSEAIRTAIRAYLRQRCEQEFMALAGSDVVSLDWRVAERQDVTEVKSSAARVRGARRGRRR